MSNLKEKVKEFLDSIDSSGSGWYYSNAEKLFDSWELSEGELGGVSADHIEGVYPDDDYSGQMAHIFKFKEGGEEVVVSLNGTYSSHDGAYYSDWHFTKQVTKTVTVWE